MENDTEVKTDAPSVAVVDPLQVEDRRLSKLAHAIDFLNHHLMAIGSRHGVSSDYKIMADEPDLLLDLTPKAIADAMKRALLNAANHVADSFAKGDD